MKRIMVDQEKCLGCQTCVMLAPKTFSIGKRGKAQVVSQLKVDSKEVKGAITNCPVGAISLQQI